MKYALRTHVVLSAAKDLPERADTDCGHHVLGWREILCFAQDDK